MNTAKHSSCSKLFEVTIAVVLLIIAVALAGCASATSELQAENPDAGVSAADASATSTQEAPARVGGQSPEPVPAVQTVAVAVSRIVDGDTIEVTMPDGATEKIRFIGVDTPESTTQVEPFGKEASAYTEQALTGKTVFLETDAEQRDRYGRLLAHVWLEVPEEVTDAEVRAHLYNAHLLLAGYANLMTIPPNVKYVDYLKNYEGEARTASIGLWAPAPAATPPPAAAAPAPTTTASAYIANRNTGKFHEAGCSSVDDMNESNKVPYSSRDAAVADGYVPCKRCNP